MDIYVVIAYFVGVFLLYVIGRLMLIPLRVIFNLIVNAVIGGAMLLIANLIGGIWGIYIGINPITALVAGLLGIPGVVLLIAALSPNRNAVGSTQALVSGEFTACLRVVGNSAGRGNGMETPALKG